MCSVVSVVSVAFLFVFFFEVLKAFISFAEKYRKTKLLNIPAAGFGTRFLPVTKSTPKEMLPKKTKGNKTYMIYKIVNQI